MIDRLAAQAAAFGERRGRSPSGRVLEDRQMLGAEIGELAAGQRLRDPVARLRPQDPHVR